MLFDDDQQLEERIVRVLGVKPQLTANEILKLVNKKKSYSIQGLYKELKKLEYSGVVSKEKKQYSLRIPWVLETIDFSAKLNSRYISGAQDIISLPAMGKKSIWHFTNLQQLNNFWSQVLLFLMQKVEDPPLFSLMEHPWYHLIFTEQEQQYIDAVHRTKTQLYIINKGKTYLDKWAEQFWNESHIEYSFDSRPLRNNPKNVYLNAIGDYVLTVKLDASISKDIEKVYNNTVDAEAVNHSEIFRVFSQKVKVTMWLEHNPAKAKKITGVFRRYFGLK